jgi:glutathione peroxidase
LTDLGVKPENVKLILLTHMHGDHIGGFLQGDARRFPNARVICAKPEYEHWLSGDGNQRTPQRRIKAVYGQDFTPFNFGDEVFTNPSVKVKALDAAGHTPGHAAFLIEPTEAQGEKLLIIGDLLHAAALQFPVPEACARFDMDHEKAVASRKRILNFAAQEKIPVAGMHLPSPSVGSVETDGGGFRFVSATLEETVSMKSFYDFTVKDIDGNDFSLAKLKGKKVMVVNVASKCGLTPQYKDLQELYTKYGSGKFTIIAFPANDFGQQEPGTDAEIKSFCTTNYGVTFPVMSKISVKGNDMHPLYCWLTEKKNNGVKDAPVEWNFQKFLIDENGSWVDVVSPREKPNCAKVLKWLE